MFLGGIMLDIAIVGLGCRFPGGARNADEFWEFLIGKGDGISEVPADRWSLDRFYDADPDAPGRMYTRHGGFLSQSPWDFDPEYFGISPREAAIMDPQQRLLLEVAVEALDDAGLSGHVSGRDVGVYVGGFTSDNQIVRHAPASRSAINSHTPTSGTFTMLSNRISYVLDLHGPSMTIDTACSSSLVAIHEAAQAVARGECEIALAGGVNAMLAPETFISMCKGRFLAPDGRCKTFDAAADGYARGEGSGVIVLKPLAAALADGDRVYAVIAASGANQDGRTSGITVPNPVAQAALARRVLDQSGLQPRDIGYIEAHGTGTAIGDPLEMQALGATYGDVPGRHTSLVVGSVKNSIGHLEAAAGVASVIKAALTVYHREIAPQAFLNELNPAIPFESHRIEIPTEPRPFPEGYDQPAAAVNGFGYGGTNAHVILRGVEGSAGSTEASAGASTAGPPRVQVFPVSGRNDAAGRAAARNLADLIAADPTVDPGVLQDAAWGRRTHYPLRAALPWTDRADLLAQLEQLATGQGKALTRAVTSDTEGPVFVFSGMGPQWWAMARDLLTTDGVFADTARVIDEAFLPISGWSIIEALLADEDSSRVTRTEVAQPANFLVQVCLTAELAALGIEPSAILGHSVGEVSAAYVSGALTLHDALLVSYHRARLQATTAGSGGMLAVGLPETEVLAWLPADGSLSVAAVNSPSSVTLAGQPEAIEAMSERLITEGIFARALKVEVPYHSHLMDPILGDIRDALSALQPRTPTLPLYSSVTAAQVNEATWGANYWVDNVRQPVHFAAAVATMIGDGKRVFLEVGPHPVLGGNIREILVRGGETGAVAGTLVRKGDDRASLAQTVADLYAAGALDISRPPGLAEGPIPYATLPSYPWQRTRLWTEVEQSTTDRLGSSDVLPMLGERTPSLAPVWQAELSSTSLPWLDDHVVDGLVLLPGAGFLDSALSAASLLTKRSSQALEDLRFVAPRIIDEHDVPVLRLSVEPTTRRFTLDSRAANDDLWVANVHGRIVDGEYAAGQHDLTPPTDGRHVIGSDLYQQLAARGLSYGPQFQGIVEAWADHERLVATVDARLQSTSRHLAHPATTDAALQCVAALVAGGPDAPDGPVVPYGMKSVRRLGPLPDLVTVAVRRLPIPGLWADIALADADGQVVLEMLGVEFRPVRPETAVLNQLDHLWYEPVWERRGTPGQSVDAPAADHSLLIVTFGEEPGATAYTLGAHHAHPTLITLPLDTDALLTRDGQTAVSAAVQTLLATGPVTVAVVAASRPAEGLQAGSGNTVLSGAMDNAAGVLGVAAAIQTALDDRLLSGESTNPPIHGIVVTEQAFGIPGDLAEVQLAHASLIGARRTLRNEQPDLCWRLVDVEHDTPTVELAAEVLASDPTQADDEVALRGGIRLVTVLDRNLAEHRAPLSAPVPMTDPQASYRVEPPASMLMSELALREVPRVAPGADQVEVRVESAGLNYKDSAKIIGLLTDRELNGTYYGTALGMEAIGTVVRVGPDVTKFAIGDRLSIGSRDSLARYLTVDLEGHGAVSLAPTPWEDTDSALNLPFLTAHYALIDTARLRAAETVLVHGAAGGVGLAAIQVARRAGAMVIATAGSDDRRAAVDEAGADVVLDSRSLNFVAEVRALTGGRGVDVVLNSAPGDVIGANLQAAAEFGRIIEIGKADIYGGGVLALAEFDRNLSFHAVDIDRLMNLRRPAMLELIATVHGLFETGDYVPLPKTVYPVSRVAEAFEAVARATHIGRVVLDFSEEAPLVLPAVPTTPVYADASYLITGGFGAFGLATADWLVRAGARHLVLVGRSGATTVAAKSRVADFTAAGVQITELAIDVASADQVAAAVAPLVNGATPLRGVFHAAGVLDDRPFTEIDAASLARVMAPKVAGALNLHQVLIDLNVALDYFVVYSSASAITGNVAQGSYAAANTVLDSLIQLRRASGLPGLTVNWGALSGGMAGSSDEVERYLATIGLRSIDIDLAARCIGEVLALGVAHTGILDIDWQRWGATHPMSASTARFHQHVAAAATAGSDSARLTAELLQLPEAQRVEVVAYMLADQLAVVLGIPAESIDLETALPDLGMDSLMAVELQARVNLALAIEVSALEFGRAGGLSGLAARIMPLLTGVATESADVVTAGA